MTTFPEYSLIIFSKIAFKISALSHRSFSYDRDVNSQLSAKDKTVQLSMCKNGYSKEKKISLAAILLTLTLNL